MRRYASNLATLLYGLLKLVELCCENELSQILCRQIQESHVLRRDGTGPCSCLQADGFVFEFDGFPDRDICRDHVGESSVRNPIKGLSLECIV